MSTKYLFFSVLLLLASSIVLTAQDTLRYEDFIKNLKKERVESSEGNKTEPNKAEDSGGRQRPKQDTKVDDVADTRRAFGVFESLVSESLTSSLFLIDQGYAGMEANGDEIIVSEDGHRPVALGVMVGNRLLTLSKTLVPWETDPKERFSGGKLDLLNYRSLEESSRWEKEDDYLSEVIGGSELAFYDNINGEGSNIQLANGNTCNNCVLVLATVDRGNNPRTSKVKLRYERVFSDWADDRVPMRLPRTTETVVGGVVLEVATEAGAMNFRVAGMLANEDGEDYLIKIPAVREIVPERGKKVKVSKRDRSKKAKKSKKVKKRKT
jgi:hypothetical protein